jgi:TonB family protein
MKPNQSLKLRIEQNGQVTDRHLRGHEEFTVGRSPDNDVVLYGDKYPKRLRMFVPNGSGYELRLAEAAHGEVSYEESRLLFSDLLLHDLLPKRDGLPALPLTPGKSGHLILDDVRIDFNFDGANAEALQFGGFSPVRAFAKSLVDDPFFKGLVVALLAFQLVLVQWASGVKIAPPDQADETRLREKMVKIAATFKRAEEIKPRAVVSTNAKPTSEPSDAEEKSEKREEEATKTAEAGEKKGYGAEKPGEGVDMSKFEVLALIGGTGASDGSSDLVNKLIKDDLAKGLDQVLNSGKLSAGRSQSGTAGTDVNAVLAHSILGDGAGGTSDIDKLLQNDAKQNKPAIRLEKKTKIDIAPIEKVSGAQEAVGARNEQSLYKVLSQNIGRLQYIYEKFLKTSPDIRGKVEVEVTINPDGSVASVTVLSSEIPIMDFQNQIRDAVRRWKYEAIAHGQMKVVYPIVFNKVS